MSELFINSCIAVYILYNKLIINRIANIKHSLPTKNTPKQVLCIGMPLSNFVIDNEGCLLWSNTTLGCILGCSKDVFILSNKTIINPKKGNEHGNTENGPEQRPQQKNEG